jgi:CDP-paratose 2-epimerase
MNLTFKDQNRIGDHMWWISDITKFKTHFPEWKQEYNLEKIIEAFII